MCKSSVWIIIGIPLANVREGIASFVNVLPTTYWLSKMADYMGQHDMRMQCGIQISVLICMLYRLICHGDGLQNYFQRKNAELMGLVS